MGRRLGPTSQTAIGSAIGGAIVLLIQKFIEHPPSPLSQASWSLPERIPSAGDIFIFIIVTGALFVGISGFRARWRRGSALTPPASLPSWLEAVVKRDRDDLRNTLHPVSSHAQRGNVYFNLDDERAPSITFLFQYVNASVFTVSITKVEGPLQVEHDGLSGEWDFQPFDVKHNARFNLRLKFVISTEMSTLAMQRLVESRKTTGESVHFNLDAVKVAIAAKEEGDVQPSELRFPQQWWYPPERREAATPSLSTLDTSGDQP